MLCGEIKRSNNNGSYEYTDNFGCLLTKRSCSYHVTCLEMLHNTPAIAAEVATIAAINIVASISSFVSNPESNLQSPKLNLVNIMVQLVIPQTGEFEDYTPAIYPATGEKNETAAKIMHLRQTTLPITYQ